MVVAPYDLVIERCGIMAENEILDVKWGQSWQGTRRVLHRADATASELASSVCADSSHAVARNLKKALQRGSSLLTILKASQGSSADLRAAVKIFPSGQLARIAAAACEICKTKDPAEVAKVAASILVDTHSDQVRAMMRGFEGWTDEARRRSAAIALEQRRDEWIESIAANLERSLRGEPAKWTRRRSLGERVTATILVSRSLRPIKRGQPNVRKQ
jgi:hypothetical protein